MPTRSSSFLLNTTYEDSINNYIQQSTPALNRLTAPRLEQLRSLISPLGPQQIRSVINSLNTEERYALMNALSHQQISDLIDTLSTEQTRALIIEPVIAPPSLNQSINYTDLLTNVLTTTPNNSPLFNHLIESSTSLLRQAIFTNSPSSISELLSIYSRQIGQHVHARHGHRTDEALHTSERTSWRSIFNAVRQNRLSVEQFYSAGAGPDRAYEFTPNDEAHTVLARQIATQAAGLLGQYLPSSNTAIIQTIQALISRVNAISDPSLRRKVKFAVDRLLRDNENDIHSGFRGRQLLLSSFSYLQQLPGGVNEAELQTFWLGLGAFIDSGDYPDAPTGDVSTGHNYTLGVFAHDPEVQSDAGLDPACYGRMRNISSSILAVHFAVAEGNRMTITAPPTAEPEPNLKTISPQHLQWTNQALSLLRFIKAKIDTMPIQQLQAVLVAFTEGQIHASEEEHLVGWLQSNGLARDANSLQTSLYIISEFKEMSARSSGYVSNEAHRTYFQSLQEGQLLVADIEQAISTHQQAHTQSELGHSSK